MANEDAVNLLRRKPRIFWGHVIRVLIERGWRPPLPNDRVLDAILGDMRRVGRHAHPYGYMKPATLELTPAELRALRLAADGYTVQEAAALVGVSRETMKDAHKRLNRKLGAKNGSHAVAIGFRKGILR